MNGLCKEIYQTFYNKKALRLVFYSFFIVALNVANIYSSYLFLGYSLSIVEIIFIASCMNLSSILPIHGIGQFGTREAINAGVLSVLGFTFNEAIQISFAIHIIGLLVQSLIAVPCYFLLPSVERKAVSEASS